ncbi:MAG: hypothetical protein M3488_12105 [Actinomycetota bacterium]|nr:hypothetical protein [Actinomycetota bacterium]
MTVVEKALKAGVKVVRRVVGSNGKLERLVRDKYLHRQRVKVTKESGPGWVQQSGGNFVVMKSTKDDGSRTGIVLRGGCDLPSIFVSAPMLRQHLKGTLAIYKDQYGGQAGASSTRQMLQTLDGIPAEHLEEARRRLKLGSRVFEPHIFEPAPFSIHRMPELGSFPKNVIVLSNGSDLTRTLHRHKEHGYLVDIGGWWLFQSLEKAIQDTDTLNWFKKNFESVGRISVEDFYTNMGRLITTLRDRTKAHVVVLNSLVIDPSKPVHNYQLLNNTHSRRRREFHLALAELSRNLDFHVIDVDRALKHVGVREQIDFVHFPVEGMMPIAEQAYRVFRELEVV